MTEPNFEKEAEAWWYQAIYYEERPVSDHDIRAAADFARRMYKAGQASRNVEVQAAAREAGRLRHGLEDPRGPVQGDFVCPNELILLAIHTLLHEALDE